MFTLLTSCRRHDLLRMTVDSLFENQHQNLFLLINEDSDDVFTDRRAMVMNSPSIGQHKAIESVLSHFNDKYYLHVEDDWLFDNKYDWIFESVKIMEADPTIIKVLCRKGSPHPCTHDKVSSSGIAYGILEPWEHDGILWSGFSWNPGVTRLDLLKKFIPFGEREQDLAAAIHEAGYKVAEISIPIYTHIGEGRSTPR